MTTNFKKYFISWTREGANFVKAILAFCIATILLLAIFLYKNQNIASLISILALVLEYIVLFLAYFLKAFVYPLRKYSGKTIRSNKYIYIILSDSNAVYDCMSLPIAIILLLLSFYGYLQLFSIKFFIVLLITGICMILISKPISSHFEKKLLKD